MNALQYAAYLADLDAKRIAAFKLDSKAFPVGTRVRTSRGALGTIVAEKGKVGYGVTTLRIQFDGVDYISRIAPAALTRI